MLMWRSERGVRSRLRLQHIEIIERYHFLKPRPRVVDLGARPGGWSRRWRRARWLEQGKGRVIASSSRHGSRCRASRFKVMDFLSGGCTGAAMESLGGKADVVLSKFGRQCDGHKKPISCASSALSTRGRFRCEVLAEGGAFLAKVIQGGTRA